MITACCNTTFTADVLHDVRILLDVVQDVRLLHDVLQDELQNILQDLQVLFDIVQDVLQDLLHVIMQDMCVYQSWALGAMKR